jgi:hypothetical protein
MSIAETARALDITPRTVNRDWLVAKAWLRNEIGIDADTACDPPDVAP